MMLATLKHVFKMKTCRNVFKNYDSLKCVVIWTNHHWIILGNLWRSSVIFENLWKALEIFGKWLETFVSSPQKSFWESSEILWKWSEIFGKLSKTMSNVSTCMFKKQKNTWLLTSRHGISLRVFKLTYHSFLGPLMTKILSYR